MHVRRLFLCAALGSLVLSFAAVLTGSAAEWPGSRATGSPTSAAPAGVQADGDTPEAGEAGASRPLPSNLRVHRETDPARSTVTDERGDWVASFTDGASTVTLVGQERTFEDVDAVPVTTDVWVRVLPEPFDGEIDAQWLERALADDGPDVLAVATEYFADAPDVYAEDGALQSAAAAYGPLQPDGSRPVGSDWHDFRGVDAVYDGKVDPADPEEYRALDCSGYVRIVYGYRFGLPLSLRPDGGTSLPRRSFEQAADAPGVTPIVDGEIDAHRLAAGDLVFFDSPDDDDGRIDHVGIHLGPDADGRQRFIHSRRSANGPTSGGDGHGASVLDGDGYFARGFVSTRRL